VRVIIAVLVTIVFSFTLNAAAQSYGFQNIPFGTSFEEVKSTLVKTYGEGSLYPPPEDDGDYIWLNGFHLGENIVQVTFHFDHNSQLYAFQFASPKYTADRLNSDVYEDGKTLTDIFSKKYGKSASRYKPSIFEINSGYVSYLSKWKHKDLQIYTGVTTYEAQYRAIAYVGSKKMIKAHEKFLADEERKSTQNAINQF